MRVRKKKHTGERIAAQEHLLCATPELLHDDPNAPFPACGGGLRLEIGCGKGSFILGESERLQDCNFFAMEMISDVIVTAMERCAAAGKPHDNVRFIIGNAANLEKMFPPSCLDAIYVNFCDPWPKAGHAKRRLTHNAFLTMYSRLLKADGVFRFKTDNEGLFDFTLEELDKLGKTPEWVTRDLHSSPYNDDNIVTEYESSFTARGFKINALSVYLNK